MNYNSMTIKELKQICKDNNYTNYSNLTKQELICYIRNKGIATKGIEYKINQVRKYKKEYNKEYKKEYNKEYKKREYVKEYKKEYSKREYVKQKKKEYNKEYSKREYVKQKQKEYNNREYNKVWNYIRSMERWGFTDKEKVEWSKNNYRASWGLWSETENNLLCINIDGDLFD
jgi:hypothetical protein